MLLLQALKVPQQVAAEGLTAVRKGGFTELLLHHAPHQRTENPHREDGSLVGVDPSGRVQHPLLGQLSHHAQQRKEGVLFFAG